jgi:lysophospholipase L1-like esterase
VTRCSPVCVVLLLVAAIPVSGDPSAATIDGPNTSIFINTAITPTPLDWDHWRSRHAKLASLAAELKPRIVFLGDSITENWSHDGRAVWDKQFAPLGAANFGIAADRTQSLLWRLREGDYGAMSPEVVVLLIGTNNLKESRNSIDETVEGIAAVLAAVQDEMPQAKMLLISLMPCDYPNCGSHRAAIDQVNRRLARVADAGRAIYLDVATLYLDERCGIDSQRMPDGLHPNHQGYTALADSIRPQIVSLLDAGR